MRRSFASSGVSALGKNVMADPARLAESIALPWGIAMR
jgi:hypothetical protein